MATLEGLAQRTQPINLGAGTVCDTTRTTQCTDDLDCPSGESCVGVAPELSFKQQVELADARCVSVSGPTRSADGGAVGVQLADGTARRPATGTSSTPYANVYDVQKEDNYSNCFFDPIDDGNTEDDFFDPSDPGRRLGPSTLCFPELVVRLPGRHGRAVRRGRVGNGEPDSGLAGATGVGTWVESRFNLSRSRVGASGFAS